MNYQFRILPGIAIGALLLVGGVRSVFGASVLNAGDIITLSNGFEYRYAGMTYGTNHVHGPLGARLVNDLPDPAEDFVKKELGNHLGKLLSVSSVEPSLCIWFDPVSPGAAATNSQRLDFWARLADETGVVGGTSYWGTASPGEPFWVQFWVVPRRTSVLEVVFFSNFPSQPPSEPVGEICRVRLPNLLYGRFPQWRPDTSFPAVKVAGDVEVHLDNFLNGVPAPNTPHTNGYYADEYRPARSGELAQAAFNVRFESVGQAKGYWVMNRAELSDATGNHLYMDVQYLYGYEYQNSFRETLWPDEGAWRLKLDLKHPAPYMFFRGAPTPQTFVPEKYGLRPEEVLTFSNVPVLAAGATNILWFTNTTGGTRIIMREYVHEPPGGGSGFDPTGLPKFHAEVADGPDGIAVDFLEATSPQGERLETGEKLMVKLGQPSSPAVNYLFTALMHPTSSIPNVNITWVVQKTRTVEFLIKPPGH